MITFLIQSMALFYFVSSTDIVSRTLTNASPPIVIPDDVIRVICSYLTYTDQRKSLYKINRRSYELVHDLNTQTIQRSIASKNQLTSLLHNLAQVSRHTVLFNLRRRMMLDEQHALHWIDVRNQFGCYTNHNTVLGQICDYEFSMIEFGAEFQRAVASIQRVYPEYQCPYNVAKIKALSPEKQHLIHYSRDITGTLYRGLESNVLDIISYVISWEVLYSLNLLPRRIDVYDDEAIHSDSKQMRELRRLITECGLMVIHPKDIAAAVNPGTSGITTIFIRDPPIARIQEGGMSRDALCARWILDVFDKMEPQQWDSLVQNLDDVQLICDIYNGWDGTLRAGDDNVAQKVRDRFNEWLGEIRTRPGELWNLLNERRLSAERKEKDKMKPQI